METRPHCAIPNRDSRLLENSFGKQFSAALFDKEIPAKTCDIVCPAKGFPETGGLARIVADCRSVKSSHRKAIRSSAQTDFPPPCPREALQNALSPPIELSTTLFMAHNRDAIGGTPRRTAVLFFGESSI